MPEQTEDIDEGWIAFIEQLRFWLEHHRGEKRATLYLSGAARQEYRSVSDALGLDVDASDRRAICVLAGCRRSSGRHRLVASMATSRALPWTPMATV